MQNYLLYLPTITGPCTDQFIEVYENVYSFDGRKIKFEIIVYAYGKVDDTEDECSSNHRIHNNI